MDIGVLVVIVFIIIFWVLPVHEQWLRDNETGQNIEDEDDNTSDTSQYPYVGSLASNIFHRSNKTCGKNIRPENLIGFDSRTDAIDIGYKPCSKCKP